VKNIKDDESRLRFVTNMLENNHTFDWQNIKIMDFETNYYKRLISEIDIYKNTREEIKFGDIV